MTAILSLAPARVKAIGIAEFMNKLILRSIGENSRAEPIIDSQEDILTNHCNVKAASVMTLY